MLFFLSLLHLVLSECEYPALSVGNFNITSERQLKDIIKKEPVFLLGTSSSSSCESCCLHEPFYKTLMETLENYRPRIPLIRIDMNAYPFIKSYLIEGESLPQIYGVRKGTFFRYFDLQEPMKVLKFADRLISPVQYLTKLEDIEEFLTPPTGGFSSLKLLALLHDSDLKPDFEKAVSSLANWFSTEIKAVTDKTLIKQLRSTRGAEVRYLNSLLVWRTDDLKVLDLDLPQDIKAWIFANCVPLVDELTPYNFHMYQGSNWPMLIMFADPGNVYHTEHVEVLRKVSRKFEEKIKFMWLDATNPEYIKKKKALGLVTEILPSFAFNSRNRANYPYPEGNEVNESSVSQFAQAFLDGKKNTYVSKYSPQNITLDSCEVVGGEDFEETVLLQGYDALFLVYSSHNSNDSEKISGVFNRVCKRFAELGYSHLRVYAFDSALHHAHQSINLSKIPRILMAPAEHKNRKYLEYTGGNDAHAIMKFVEKNADVGIRLPELSHLSAEEVEEFRKLKDADKASQTEERSIDSDL